MCDTLMLKNVFDFGLMLLYDDSALWIELSVILLNVIFGYIVVVDNYSILVLQTKWIHFTIMIIHFKKTTVQHLAVLRQ